MYMIEISEDKKEKMSEYIEKILHYGGRLMSCLEEMDGEMGERGDYNMRSPYEYSSRYDNYRMYGNRNNEMGDEDMMMGERRRRSRRTGRYM